MPRRVPTDRPGKPTGLVRSWYDAWREVSVGERGFWRAERPGTHFRTGATTRWLAGMVLSLLTDRPEIATVVDIGAGDARLLAEISILAPQLRLIGLDLRPKPSGLAAEWLTGVWDVANPSWMPGAGGRESVPLRSVLPTDAPMIIICAEWLDDLPAVVGERGRHGWRHVLVRPDGRESLGGPVPAPDAHWLDQWWPAQPGQRVESGRTRDLAWSAVVDCLRTAGGSAIMIDYGHLRTNRPAGGSLTGYHRGRQLPPRPSAAINLTAHVAVDSVRAAGEAAGAQTELMITQRNAVGRWLEDRQPGELRREPSDTLARLQAASERRLLAETLGEHWWLVQSMSHAAPTAVPAAEPSATERGPNPPAG